LTPMVSDFAGSNGLAFSPDEKRMYVNDTPRAHIRVFDMKADGSFGEGHLFYTLQGEEPGHADGMKVDTQGNVYCTGPVGFMLLRLTAPCWGGCTSRACVPTWPGAMMIGAHSILPRAIACSAPG